MSNFICFICGHNNCENEKGDYDTYCDCSTEPHKREGNLFLIIKDEWLKKIKTKEKTSEFREFKPYNITRILKKPFKTVTFAVGYSKNREIVTFNIECIRVTREPNDLKAEKCIEIVLGDVVNA